MKDWRRILAIVFTLTTIGLTLILLYHYFTQTRSTIVYYYLSIETRGSGSVEITFPKDLGRRISDDVFKIANGTRITLIIKASSGWELQSIKINGEGRTYPINTTIVRLPLTITKNTTVGVLFSKIPEFELKVIIEGEGIVEPAYAKVERGKTVDVVIRPAKDWFIESVRLDGEYLGAVDKLSIEMWNDRILEVKFHRWAYLNITLIGNGTCEVKGAELVDGIYRAPEGTNITVSIKCSSSLREEWYIHKILLDGEVLFELNRSQKVSERALSLSMTGHRKLVVELNRVVYVILKLEVVGNGTVWIEGYKEELENGVYTVERLKPLKIYFKPSNWLWLFRKIEVVGKGEILELHKDHMLVMLENDSTIKMTFEKRELPEGIRGYVTKEPVSLYGNKIVEVNRTTYIIDGGDFVVDAFIPLEKEWYRIKVKVIVELIPLTEEGKNTPVDFLLAGFVGADEENRPDYHGVCICAIGGFEAIIELWREEWVFIWEEHNITLRRETKYKVEFKGTLDPRYTKSIYPSGYGGTDIPMGYHMIYMKCQDSTIPIDAWVKVILIVLEIE